MSKKRLESNLQEFVAKIRQMNQPAFVGTANWRLLDDIQNGVDIGYDLASATDRMLLHDIGKEFGLIPLCPRDVIDIERSVDSSWPVVRTPFGTMRIGRRPD